MPDAPDSEEIVRLVARCGHGDSDALNHLTPIVYAELKALAANAMRRERANHTLQTTALVNEACLRLLGRCGDEDGAGAERRELAGGWQDG